MQLLRTTPLRTEYCLRLPAGWRDISAVSRAAQARITTVQAAGLAMLVERYNYRWTPERGMPARPSHLEFRPEPDDAVILDVFRQVHQDSLDAHARATIAASGLEAARPGRAG